MTTTGTTIRALTSPLRVPRLLAALALAAALAAVPAVRPDGAGAERRSEGAITAQCNSIGGEIYYDFVEADAPSVYSMTCSVGWWFSYTCYAGNTFYIVIPNHLSCPGY